MSPQASDTARTLPSRATLRLLVAASGVSAALGLAVPIVALALTLAYAFAHLQGALRLFLGYMAVTLAAGMLPRAIRLRETLRFGQLKVSGAVVTRSAAPARFWRWTVFEIVVAGLYGAGAVACMWLARQVT